mmetsp:Transcript_108161/g.312569  ORF Transcript_108161/g.312569 Transcript_108161/m.312569 type:complete len:100 (+) Transcript_108161:1005-1304(+)
MGSACAKFLRSDARASYMKFKLSKPLKTSSVNLVQKRINELEPPKPRSVKKKLVHNPTQVYTGKNGTSFKVQKRNRPEMKAKVSPVGAMNAIGCPQRTA